MSPLALPLLLCTVFSASPDARLLERNIPADALAVYVGRPATEQATTQPGGAGQAMTAWMIALGAMGVIPDEGRVLADVLATLPLVNRQPHALALLDITAKQVAEDSYRLDDMQAALLIDGTASAADFDRRIRTLLMTYTSADVARVETVETLGVRYHRLIDERGPKWAVVEWGRVGDQYWVGFGSGAFERLLKTRASPESSLAADGWYRRADDVCHGPDSRMRLYANLQRTRQRIGEVVKGRPEEVLTALQLAQIKRLVWTQGFEGRALRCELYTQNTQDLNDYRILAGDAVTDRRITAAIPPQADAYGVLALPLADTFHTIQSAYLQSQSDRRRQRWRRGWTRIEKEYDFDVASDLIAHLGDNLVVHTYPPHPLRLPLLWTFWIEHKGHRQAVERTINGMMRAWATTVNEPEEPQRRFTLSPRVHQDPDGVWYLQLGLLGPAVGVADQWIVVSFSPHAVRRNLEYLKARAGALQQ